MPFTTQPILTGTPSAVVTKRSTLSTAIATRDGSPTPANQAAAVVARDDLIRHLASYRASVNAAVDAEIKSAMETV